MQHSESLKNLAGALSKAQAEMPVASENAKNPHLGNKYADLGAIIAAARPVLAKHGLAVSQFPMSDGGNIGVETILLHESGEWMSNTMLMDTSSQKGLNDAQVVGLTISYFRRYAFAAVLAIYTGDDTDGASGKKEATDNSAKPVTAALVVAAEWAKVPAHAEHLINVLGIGKMTMGEATKLYNIYRPWRTDGKLEAADAAAKAHAGEIYVKAA
jgi:ERF superfamily.